MVITLSNPEQTRVNSLEFAPTLDCYSDQFAEGFRTYGLTRGNVFELLGPEVMVAAIKLSHEGYKLGAPMNDVLQMPGTFVINTEGKLSLAYYSRHAGDYPTEHLILNAIPTIGLRQDVKG